MELDHLLELSAASQNGDACPPVRTVSVKYASEKEHSSIAFLYFSDFKFITVTFNA